jgi:outer membrane protein
MKSVFLVLIVGLLSGSLAWSEVKIGVVDMQKVVQASTAGKKAKTELESEYTKKKMEFEKQEGQLKKSAEELSKKKSVLSEEVYVKKQSELQEEMMKFRESVGQSQYEIQKKQQDLTLPIVEKIRKTISKIAKEKSYTMVAETGSGILYAEPTADITEEVLKTFETEK